MEKGLVAQGPRVEGVRRLGSWRSLRPAKGLGLVDVWDRMRARLQPGYRPRYYRDPCLYWERRHARAGSSLEGVGLLGLGSESNSKDYDCKWRHVKAALEGVDPSRSRRVLDAGCGNGWFTTRVADLGFAVDGVDFSREAIDIARQNSPSEEINWYLGELSEFVSPERYEIVICIDVLFHIVDDHDWQRAVRNLGSLLGGQGYLIIQEALADEQAIVDDPDRRHVNFRTEAAYRATLEGWRFVERDSYRLPTQGSNKDLMIFRKSNEG